MNIAEYGSLHRIFCPVRCLLLDGAATGFIILLQQYLHQLLVGFILLIMMEWIDLFLFLFDATLCGTYEQ